MYKDVVELGLNIEGKLFRKWTMESSLTQFTCKEGCIEKPGRSQILLFKGRLQKGESFKEHVKAWREKVNSFV